MTNNINPADCPPDRVYMGTVDGERVVVRRNDPDNEWNCWETMGSNPEVGGFCSDSQVSDLVLLVEARPITRDDLPSMSGVFGEVADGNELNGAGKYREAVIERLNENGGVPAPGVLSGAADCVLESAERVKAAEADVARWRRAHGIVEAERDQARNERDEAVRARNAALVRVRQAEDERDEALGKGLAALADAERERDEWKARAEKAEARTAVTLDDIEKAIRETEVLDHRRFAEFAARAVFDLVSGDDPAVYVVRESQIDECQRNENGDWEFRHGGRVFHDSRDPKDRAESLAHHREQIVQRVAIVRAIEAEAQSPRPGRGPGRADRARHTRGNPAGVRSVVGTGPRARPARSGAGDGSHGGIPRPGPPRARRGR